MGQRIILLVWLFVGLMGCDESSLQLSAADISVQILSPDDGATLALSVATEIEVQASSPQGPISDLWLLVEPADCPVGGSCFQTVLHRSGAELDSGRARFCLTSKLAEPEICAHEADRIDVTGFVEGHRFIVEALAQTRAKPSAQARSASRAYVLRDDRSPQVFLQNPLRTEDGIYGPGDRIPVALRVVDEQSGVSSVHLHISGLGGLADRDEEWFVPPHATDLSGVVTLSVPADFFCPGAYQIQVVAKDKAQPANVAVVDFGPGCVGTCSDRQPPHINAFNVDVEGVEPGHREPLYAGAGELLRIDDVPFVSISEHLYTPPVVELVYSPPREIGGDDKSSVVGVFSFGTDGYSYTLRGDEPAGPYLVRVTVVDEHCNTAVATEPLLVDYTPVPQHFAPADRSPNFLRLHWLIQPHSPAPRHLSWQAYARDESPDPAAFVPVNPAASSDPVVDGAIDSDGYEYYIHDGLIPATRYAYRLVIESDTTPGLMLHQQQIPDDDVIDVCTLPTAPQITDLNATQVSLSARVGLAGNPEGTPLSVWLCSGQSCRPGNSCQYAGNPEEDCTALPIEDLSTGQIALDGLEPDYCYALLVRAQGCGQDKAESVQCIATQEMLDPPDTVNVRDRDTSSVTFEWQRLVGENNDPVVGYEIIYKRLPDETELTDFVAQSDEGTLPSFTVGALNPGQQARVQIRAKLQSDGVGQLSPAYLAYSRAAVPPNPQLDDVENNTFAMTLQTGANGDNCATTYSLFERVTTRFVQADGSLGPTPYWSAAGQACDGPFVAQIHITGLSPNADYSFESRARNGDLIETTASVNPVTWVTWPETPHAPSLETDHQGGLVASFGADPNPERTPYAIFVGPWDGLQIVHSRYASLSGALVDDPEYWSVSQWQAVTGVAIHGLVPNSQYGVALQARNNDPSPHGSALGPAALAWTRAATPQSIRVGNRSAFSVGLNWDSAQNPSDTAYRVEYSLDGQTWSPQPTSSNSATLTGLLANRDYQAQVIALRRDPLGEDSPASEIFAFVTPATMPLVPVVSQRSSTTLGLSLNPAEDENPDDTKIALLFDGQFVDNAGQTYVGPDPGAFSDRSNWGNDVVTLACDSPGSRHQIGSVAQGRDGDLVFSAMALAWCNPLASSGLQISAGTDPNSSLTLSWQDVGNDPSVQYGVERCLGLCSNSDTQWTTVFSSSVATAFADSALTPGATYSYRVRATIPEDSQALPALSAIVSDTTAVSLPATPILSLSSSSDLDRLDVTLAADGNADDARYAIELWTGGTPLGWVRQDVDDDRLDPGAAHYLTLASWGAISVSGLQENTVYSAFVVAQNSQAEGAVRSLESAPRCTRVAPPASITAGPATQVAVQLSWQSVPRATYRLERSSDTVNFSAIYQGAATSYLASGIAANTAYVFRVFGLNQDGVASLTASQVNVTTLPGYPLAPTDLVVNNVNNPVVAAQSDNPITTWRPFFSARHHDEAPPTAASQVQLYVRRQSDQMLVANTIYSLSPTVADGNQVPYKILRYLHNPMPDAALAGAGFNVVGVPDQGKLFALKGGNRVFFELNQATNVWTQRANANHNMAVGADMTYSPDDGCLYVIEGGGSARVERFDLTALSWADQSAGTCGGAAANGAIANAHMGASTYLFVYPGAASQTYLHRVGATWNCLAIPPVPDAAGAGPSGADLVVVGSYLFYQPGSGRAGLYSYDLSQFNFAATGPAGVWQTVVPTGASLPIVSVAGSLVKISDSVLAIFSGGASGGLYWYDFSAGDPTAGSLVLVDGSVPGGLAFSAGGSRLAYWPTGSRLVLVHGESRALWSAHAIGAASSLIGYPGDNRVGLELNGTVYEYWLRFADGPDSENWGTWSPVATFTTHAP